MEYEVARFDAPEAREDELVAECWRLGCAGSWTRPAAPGRIHVEAFFDRASAPAPGELRAAADAAQARLVDFEAAEERDWLASWREGATPIEVGERFRVDPREPVEPPAELPGPEAGGRILLRLPARTAFGVGSHESTRLVVETLETLPVAGRAVLDVGTGTGILAFVALELGARRVVAFDVDPAAAALLPQTMALNGRRFAAFAGTIAALAGHARFDLALVNVVPPEIAADLPALAARLAPGALAVFSGLLDTQVEAAAEGLARHGLVERARRTAGEWVALVVERTP